MSFINIKLGTLAHERLVQKARKLLGLTPEFTLEEVKDQFAHLAKLNHPDHGGCENSAITMGELIHAKDVCRNHLEILNG